MKDCREILMPPNTPIIKAIEIIDSSSLQIGLIVDQDQHLLGTITDGDIRRGILRGVSLETSVQEIMNRNPVSYSVSDKRETVLNTMKRLMIHQIPITDAADKVIGIETLDEIIQLDSRDNLVVLMAGGMGSRLQPLTNVCPKPLLKVGGKPILENIIEGYREYGFKKFSISINYMGRMIQDYFADGSQWGVEIEYVCEEKSMGTAGALGLLPNKPDQPFFVMNGDLLTKVNYQSLLDFHKQNNAAATMCVREYTLQVPYGVVAIDGNRLRGIDEKPEQRFFVNAGIYVFNPDVLELISDDNPLDMPALFDQLVERQMPVNVFPIREYWLDIGQATDFERANVEFSQVFK